MRFKSTAQFVSQTLSKDADGSPQATETTGSAVFCIVESVGITENYAAMSAGFRPDIRLKVRLAEYNGQPQFVYGGKRYRVIRTQSAEKGFTVLVGELVDINVSVR